MTSMDMAIEHMSTLFHGSDKKIRPVDFMAALVWHASETAKAYNLRSQLKLMISSLEKSLDG